MTFKKKEPVEAVPVPAAVAEAPAPVVPPVRVKKEKPPITCIYQTPGGRLFIATATTIYEKKGEELVAVKWQVPE